MESPWKTLWLSFYVSLYFSLFGLIFTLGVSGAYALALRAGGSKWMMPPAKDKPERTVPFILLAVLGGIGGDFAAVNSVFVGEWWICRTQHQLCYDGQGGIILIYTVPFFAVVGALIAWGWTWLTLGVSDQVLWTSVFRYSGRYRAFNWVQAILIPVMFWALVGYGLARVSLGF